jgi:hypothetical protein
MKTEVLTGKPKQAVYLDDLKDFNHVGFIDQYKDKGYIIYTGDGFMAISNRTSVQYCNVSYGNNDLSQTLIGALNTDRVCAVSVDVIYRFDTRRELYAWLAE